MQHGEKNRLLHAGLNFQRRRWSCPHPEHRVLGTGAGRRWLAAAGTSADKVGMAALAGTSVVYRGMELLGGGAILAGMILGAVAAFIIDRDFDRAAVYALAGAVLAFFGFIHGAKLGVGESAGVALGYLLFAVICWSLARRATAAPR